MSLVCLTPKTIQKTYNPRLFELFVQQNIHPRPIVSLRNISRFRMTAQIPTNKTSLLKQDERFKEKRKWQLAFRRYVLEAALSENYARFFGMDRENLRKWFGFQFDDIMNWENFGTAWQFEHIVPVALFNFEEEEDLKLCWNFINIRVEPIYPGHIKNKRIEPIASKAYFKYLYEQTGLALCTKMIDKLEAIELEAMEPNPALEGFILQNKDWLEQIPTLSREEFTRFTEGIPVKDLLLEREILKKFG